MLLSERRVLITGANGGIGGAVARRLAKQHAFLILVVRNRDDLGDFVEELRELGAAGVQVLSGDLSQSGVPEEIVAAALREHERIDVLINCAGVQNFGFFADESANDTLRLFAVNTVAPIAMTNAVLPHMLMRGGGRIVNVGSIFGSIGFPCFATYSASKFAVRGFSEALRRELADTGVKVVYVAPRFTRTPFNSGRVNRMAEALGMNRDDPEAVAGQVVAAIEQGASDRYLGWPEKLFVRINAIFPRLVDPSLMRMAERMRPFANERA
jgi:short-subunit dehydrogenase